MRLIDGNKIVMLLADWWHSSFGQEETEESKAIKKVIDQVEKIVVEMPEIVRCKDCKWFDVNRANFVEGYGYCEVYEVTGKDSHYCSYGELKEEKQITGKLNNPDDSLLTKNLEVCKEQKSKLDTDLISRQAAIELACWRCKKCERKDCEHKDSCETMRLLDALPSEDPKPPMLNNDCISREQAIEAMAPFDTNHELRDTLDNLPPVTPTVSEDCISRKDAIEALLDHVNIPTQAQREYAVEIFENIPPVEPKRPKGEWVSCSEPPKDRRNVFIAHGTNDFKSCCIGHYEQGMGWYEDRNFFAKPIYDCKYWCDIPELPDLGNNQFGTEVSADIRGDKE